MKCSCCEPATEGTATQLVKSGHRVTDEDEDIKLEPSRERRKGKELVHLAKREHRAYWTVEDQEYIEERPDGTYQLSKYYRLSREELERMYTTIGQLLEDLDTRNVPY